MSTALVSSTPANTPIASIYGKFDVANAFDTRSPLVMAAVSIMGCPLEQGPAVLLHAMALNMSVVDLSRNYHWIEGRPSMRADAMLANFRMNFGGQYVVKERSFDAAEIEFTDARGNLYPCRLTWQELLQSPYPWVKDKGPGDEPIAKNLKKNYSTQIGRRSMMFNRLVSDSLRFICPELVSGVYTPEEMQDVSDDRQAAPTVFDSEPAKSALEVAQAAAAAGMAPDPVSVGPFKEEQVVEAEYTVKDAGSEAEPTVPVTTPETPAEVAANATQPPVSRPTDPNVSGSITDEQLAEMDDLTMRLREHGRLPEARWERALKSRNASVPRNLSANQAAVLLGNLRDEAASLPKGN